jgi:hypothetical protein
MRKSLRKPSPAMIVACLALFIALTGTGVAASHYIITSTKQIKPSVLAQLKGARGPQGPPGARGPQGPAGAPGAAGTNGLTHVVVRTVYGPTDDSSSTARAVCNTGEVATGGGVAGISADSSNQGWPVVIYSAAYPQTAGSTPTGWEGSVDNADTSGQVQAEAFVICASS